MQCSNATCYNVTCGINTCFHVPCSDHFLFSLFWSDSLQFYMTTVCWLYVHSLGFFNSYIDLNQYAQDNEKAHFSTASFVFKESKYDLSVYPPEIGPLVHKDLYFTDCFNLCRPNCEYIYLHQCKDLKRSSIHQLYWPNLLLVWGCVWSGSCGLDRGYRHLLAVLGSTDTETDCCNFHDLFP